MDQIALQYGDPTPKSNGKVPTHYQSARRRFRGEVCAAALRAVTGARLYLDGAAPTVAFAANATGSCPAYIAAAIIILQSESKPLLDDVLCGRIAILAAATMAAPLAALMIAFRKASPQALTAFSITTGPPDDLAALALRSGPEQRAAAGRALGPETTWEQLVLPSITAEKAAASTGAPVFVADVI